MMLSEYLLWITEGVIEGTEFASLVPIMREESKVELRLSGEEVLKVRDIYLSWFAVYSKTGSFSKLPLDGTSYSW